MGGFEPNLVIDGNKKSASTFSEVSLTMPKHIASATCLFGISSETASPPVLDFLIELYSLTGPNLKRVRQDNR